MTEDKIRNFANLSKLITKDEQEEIEAQELELEKNQQSSSSPMSRIKYVSLEQYQELKTELDTLKKFMDQTLAEKEQEEILPQKNNQESEASMVQKESVESFQIIEEIIAYIKKYKIKSFNINDPKFRSTQIEKVVTIMKDLYEITRKVGGI